MASGNKAKYTYKVKAYITTGNEVYKNEASIARSSCCVKKTSIASIEISGKGVSVKWKKVSGASGYIIYRDGKK